MERLFCQFLVFPRFLNCLLLLIYIFLFDLFFFACLLVFTQVGPSVPKTFRDDFFTRMGPSVPEILRGDVSPKWVHLCRRYLTVIFSRVIFSPKCECALSYLRPSVPEILIGVIFYTHAVAWDHLCPKHTTLPENNFYCGEVVLPTCCCLSPFLTCLLLFIYTFIQLVLFCLLIGSFSFLFQMCSSQGCSANSLPDSRIICSHGLAASRKQCLHHHSYLSG